MRNGFDPLDPYVFSVVRQLRGGALGGRARPGELPHRLQRLDLGHQSWHRPGPGRGRTAGQHSYSGITGALYDPI